MSSLSMRNNKGKMRRIRGRIQKIKIDKKVLFGIQENLQEVTQAFLVVPSVH